MPQNRLLAELSLWSADLAHLADEMCRTEHYADLYHIDAADGHFVPLLLFFPDLVARLRPLTKTLFHVHLMAEGDTLFQQIADFTRAGADLITIHAENGTAAPEALNAIQRDHVAAVFLSMILGANFQSKREPVDIPYHSHDNLKRGHLLTEMGATLPFLIGPHFSSEQQNRLFFEPKDGLRSQNHASRVESRL